METNGNSEKGTSKDKINEKAVENERKNSRVQQLKHTGGTKENEKSLNVTRFEKETGKTAMDCEKIATIKD